MVVMAEEIAEVTADVGGAGEEGQDAAGVEVKAEVGAGAEVKAGVIALEDEPKVTISDFYGNMTMNESVNFPANQ